MKRAASVRTILFLAANPRDMPALRLGEEIREIEAGLRRASQRDRFSLVQRWAVRPKDVRQAILDVKPQIVHFSGHGAGEGGLVLENLDGQSQLVESSALAGLFELFAQEIECVLLNACYSEAQADAITQHIPYVIGMSHAIGDSAAIEFAIGFYDALGAGKPVETAYKFGCNAVQLEGIPEHTTPVLKCKARTRAPKDEKEIAHQNISLPASEIVDQAPSVGITQKKVCMLGAAGVGKTSLVSRYVQSFFSEKYQTTVGVKIDSKMVNIGGRRLRILLWDIEGEDEFVQPRMNFLRGASGYILVADGTRPNTLIKAAEIRSRVQNDMGELPFVLLLNKHDLVKDWKIEESQIRDYSSLGWMIHNTSAKMGTGVEEAFQALSVRMLNN